MWCHREDGFESTRVHMNPFLLSPYTTHVPSSSVAPNLPGAGMRDPREGAAREGDGGEAGGREGGKGTLHLHHQGGSTLQSGGKERTWGGVAIALTAPRRAATAAGFLGAKTADEQRDALASGVKVGFSSAQWHISDFLSLVSPPEPGAGPPARF